MKLLSIFKTPLIEFLCREEDYGVLPEPIPANKMVPEWFKRIPPQTKSGTDRLGGLGMTGKKCLPMLDAMTLGFIIPLAGDVNVRTNKDSSLIETSNSPYFGKLIEFHSNEQLGGKGSPSYPSTPIKFTNRWFIKTAPGYSSLFIPCVNTFENRFTTFSAVVDTDKYFKEVNFPAVWNIPDHNDTLKAGTPLITVIPFKREDMVKQAPVRKITPKEMSKVRTIQKIQDSRNNYYTKELRDKDEH